MLALRADFVGASRDKVAPPEGRTEIFLSEDFIEVKFPG